MVDQWAERRVERWAASMAAWMVVQTVALSVDWMVVSTVEQRAVVKAVRLGGCLAVEKAGLWDGVMAVQWD